MSAAGAAPVPLLSLEPLPFGLRADELRRRGREAIARATARLAAVLDEPGTPTIPALLAPVSDIVREVRDVGSHGSLVFATDVDAETRSAGRELSEASDAFLHALRLNERLYARLGALDLGGVDRSTRYAIEKLLREMRREGVEKDEPTRRRLIELNREIDLLMNQFGENIAKLVREIELHDPDDLAGLPDDYRSAHPPDASGRIRITTSYPDCLPLLKYADRSDVRRRMLTEFLRRAYPENAEVLTSLLARRRELAHQLGYPTYAAFAIEDKMLGTPEATRALLERVRALLDAPARDDRDRFLERKRRSEPDATRLEPWDAAFWGTGYYDEKIRTEEFGVDLRRLRAFLPYPRVRDGLFDLCRELFGLEFRRADGAPTWHPTVEAYDVVRDGAPIGRAYLDLTPRPGKFSHAACFTVRDGIAGRMLPQTALICNFLDPGTPAERARLEYAHVVTFFHEFGHLLHALLSGHGTWIYNSQSNLEWDFIEAPSLLFEEWARDPATLARFAIDPDSGSPAPPELLARLRASEALGRPTMWFRQVALAEVSLRLHDDDAAGLDPAGTMRDVFARFRLPIPPEFHPETSFGHLAGYSALYYTYLWSAIIARDLLTPFRERGSLTDPEIAARYAREILSPGSERPAAELVRNYLGRDFRFEAFERWATDPPRQLTASDSGRRVRPTAAGPAPGEGSRAPADLEADRRPPP
jgi:thimet oligopeptidase